MTTAMFRVVDALVKHGELTANELTLLASVPMRKLRRKYISTLASNGMVYRSGWRKHRHGFAPVYSAGIGTTPNRPKVAS